MRQAAYAAAATQRAKTAELSLATGSPLNHAVVWFAADGIVGSDWVPV